MMARRGDYGLAKILFFAIAQKFLQDITFK